MFTLKNYGSLIQGNKTNTMLTQLGLLALGLCFSLHYSGFAFSCFTVILCVECSLFFARPHCNILILIGIKAYIIGR